VNRLAGKSARLFIAAIALGAAAQPAAANGKTFLARFGKIRTLASMVPASGRAKGDQNPYGVAVVTRSSGALVRGDVLV
jgi:hypothetical protein